MAVDTHGIEAIRKAIDELVPGDPSNTIMKIKGGANDGDTDNTGPVKVGSRTVDQASPLTATTAGLVVDVISDLYRRPHINRTFNVGALIDTDSADGTAARIDSPPSPGRQKVYIVNMGNLSLFLGFTSGVTINSGIEIPRGMMFDEFFGESIPLFLITGGTTVDYIFVEMG